MVWNCCFFGYGDDETIKLGMLICYLFPNGISQQLCHTLKEEKKERQNRKPQTCSLMSAADARKRGWLNIRLNIICHFIAPQMIVGTSYR